MKEPARFDTDGYTDELDDYEGFKRLFNDKYNSIDEERAKESYKTTFKSTERLEHKLFTDVVNAFSDGNAAEGSDSGFETRIVNPLYEFGDPGAEVLLANMSPTGVHLCFVSCEIGGEDSTEWMERVNKTSELMKNAGLRRKLKQHIRCPGLDINSVQYLTFTRQIDLIDADVDVLKVGTNPDNYAIWKLISESVEGKKGDEEIEDREIKSHDGTVEHPKLEDLARKGIDPTISDNDDIKYNLTSHPIYPIGEVLLDIYLERYPSGEHPKEFNEGEFEESYQSNIHLGMGRSRLEKGVEDKIQSLLETAEKYDMIEDNADEIEERDYKIMWQTEDPGDIKDMVRDKFFSGKAPEERGKLALKRAKEQFTRKNEEITDY